MTISTSRRLLARVFLIFLSTLVLIPQLSYADEIPLLEPVEVSVPSQADRSYSVTIITRDDTEGMHFTNLNDALFSGTPGVSTSRRSETGFGGPNAGFLIRGLNGARVPVFVDGIPIQINNHFHARVDRYSSDMIDRMEITRGPSVLKHGASAVGGVVDIYTRKPGKGFSGFVEGAYGRYNTQEVFGDIAYGWGSGSILFSGSDRLTDGPPVVAGPSAGVATAEAHDLTNVNLKISQAINDTWSVGFRGSNAQEVPEDFPFSPGVSHRRFGQDETDLVFHIDRKTASSNSLVAYHDNRLDNFNGNYTNGVLNAGTTLSRRVETETGVLARHTWLRGGGNTITLGGNFVEYSDSRFTGSAQDDQSSHYSGYIQATQAITDSITVDGGVRVTAGEDFDTELSPEIGIVKKFSPSLAVRVRGGKAFRVPRLGEVDTNNDPLRDPESFYHAEVGVNQRFNNGAEFDITGWWMKGDNLIVSVAGGQFGTEASTGKFNQSGLEAYLSFPLTKHLSGYTGLTLMSLETTGAAPQTTFDAGLQYRQGPFRGNLAFRGAGRNADPNLASENYNVFDGRIQYKVHKYLELFVNVDNITDTDYVTNFSTFAGGFNNVNVERLIMLGGRLKFR